MMWDSNSLGLFRARAALRVIWSLTKSQTRC